MEEISFLNQYRCPLCGAGWENIHDCVCNDCCPKCNAEIEPLDSLKLHGVSK